MTQHVLLALPLLALLAVWLPGMAVAQDASLDPDALTLVGLGDSFAGGQIGCAAPCRPFLEIYEDLASEALARPVTSSNLATSDSLESGGLLTRIRGDRAHHDALVDADLVTLMIGWNDWQGPCGFDGLQDCLARNSSTVEANVDAILEEIASLRGEGAATAVRVVTYPDIYIGSPEIPAEEVEGFEATWRPALTAFNAMLCDVARAHGALCVDTRTPFNGPAFDQDAGAEPADGALLSTDHVHPSAAGHERIAQAIAEVGFAPLQ